MNENVGRPSSFVVESFNENPRMCAPVELTRALAEVAVARALAIVVDLDALDRTGISLDRPLVLALDAVAHAGVEVVLVSRDREPTAVISRARYLGPVTSPLEEVRGARDLHVIAIGDDGDLFDALAERDRGLSLGCDERANVVRAGELSVRSALWWLVKRRLEQR